MKLILSSFWIVWVFVALSLVCFSFIICQWVTHWDPPTNITAPNHPFLSIIHPSSLPNIQLSLHHSIIHLSPSTHPLITTTYTHFPIPHHLLPFPSSQSLLPVACLASSQGHFGVGESESEWLSCQVRWSLAFAGKQLRRIVWLMHNFWFFGNGIIPATFIRLEFVKMYYLTKKLGLFMGKTNWEAVHRLVVRQEDYFILPNYDAKLFPFRMLTKRGPV